MEVIIDKYGRIVIPKPFRDRLGLNAGSALEISIGSAGPEGELLALRPAEREDALKREGHVLVHTGVADEPVDPVEAVRRSRDDRIRTLSEFVYSKDD